MSAGTGSPPPRVLADVFARTRVHDGALVLGAALFTALLAQVAIAVPGSPVPITGQTLAVVLTAAALGPVSVSPVRTLSAVWPESDNDVTSGVVRTAL